MTSREHVKSNICFIAVEVTVVFQVSAGQSIGDIPGILKLKCMKSQILYVQLFDLLVQNTLITIENNHILLILNRIKT